MPETIRAILIDLDGVIRIWPRPVDRVVDPANPTVDDAVFPVAFAPHLLHEAITGAITDEAWRQETIERLTMDWPGDEAERAVAAWTATVPIIDQRVRELVRDWRQTVPVVLVTNATSRLHSDLDAMGLLGDFDAIIDSSAIGAAKPDVRIFAAALARAGVTPTEALFIDDTPGHVDAARELGLIGYLFDGGVDPLSRFVRRWLPGRRASSGARLTLPLG